MVFVQAARKTAGLMVLAMMASLALIFAMSGDLQDSVTGHAVQNSPAILDGNGWIIFLLGIFVGAIMIGAYFYIAHLEGKRQE